MHVEVCAQITQLGEIIERAPLLRSAGDVAWPHERAVIVSRVGMRCDANLSEVVHALGGARRFAGVSKRGQQHRGEDREDCDDDQKLDEREGDDVL